MTVKIEFGGKEKSMGHLIFLQISTYKISKPQRCKDTYRNVWRMDKRTITTKDAVMPGFF